MKVALKNLVEIKSGYSPSTFELMENGSIPYVKVEDMNNCTKYQNESREYCEDADRSVPAGAIIFPKRGAAIMNNKVRITATDICMDTNMMAIIPTGKIQSEFLYYTITHEKLSRIADTSTIPQINNKHINPYKVALPPLPEQKAIAALLSTWDKAIEKTERLIQAKEKRFKWLLRELISEPRKTQKDAKWIKVKIGSFLTESRNPDRENDPKKRLSVRLHLKGVEVRDYRGTESDGATVYFVRKAGQFIYGKQNVFRGSVGIVPLELDGYSSTQDIPAFDVASNVDKNWLLFLFSYPNFYKRLELYASGSGSKRLHPKELFKMKVALPSFEEQQEISETLSSAQHEVDLLKQLADKYKTQKRGLMQKMLTGIWRMPSVIIDQFSGINEGDSSNE